MKRRTFLHLTAGAVAATLIPAWAQQALHAERLGDRDLWVRPGRAGGPLVLAFHGHGGSGSGFANRMRIHDLWPEATVVYPQGEPRVGKTDPEGTKPGWQQTKGSVGDRDLDFFDALLKRFGDDADPRHIHVLGHSNGARFTLLVWCVRGRRIASLGAASGPGVDLVPLAPPRSVFWIMGENDPIVSPQSMRRSIEESRELLRTRPETRTQSGYLSTETGQGGLEVATYTHPGGHAVPLEAVPLMVSFLQRNPLLRS